MLRTMLTAVVALLAGCKGAEKLSGLYAKTQQLPDRKLNDTLILNQQDKKSGRYEIARRTYVDYKDPSKKDTVLVSVTHGTHDTRSNSIRVDSARTRYSYNTRTRQVYSDLKTWNRVGW